MIRVEFGKVLQSLFRDWFTLLLESILRISLGCHKDDHAIVLSVFAIMMSTLEIVACKAARPPYHLHHFPSTSSNFNLASGLHHPFAPDPAGDYFDQHGRFGSFNAVLDGSITPDTQALGRMLAKVSECAQILLKIYANCFRNCHYPLLQAENRRAVASAKNKSAAARFLETLNVIIRDHRQYLEAKSGMYAANNGEDILSGLKGHVDIFDRLTSRLLLLRCG